MGETARKTITTRRRTGVALLFAAVLAGFVVPAQGGAGEADEILMTQPLDAAFTLPTVSLVLADVDEGGTTCRYDLTGSGRVSRPSGSGVVTERGSAAGSTNCSKNLTTTLTITDSSVGGPPHSMDCLSTAFKSSSCSTSQVVSYFTPSGVLTRPTSTINFRYRLLTGNKERVCFDYKVTLVGGTAAAHGAGPCESSAIGATQ
jgi:hypothetical protein